MYISTIYLFVLQSFPSFHNVNITEWMHYLDVNEANEEKARWKLQKNATCCLEQILEATPHKTVAV